MLRLDGWREMFDQLSHHKLRTLLTAMSVAWGIFMLVILLGAGRGLQHGVERDFKDDAVNALWIRGGKTSLPYKGNAPGKRVNFKDEDIEAISRELPDVEHITGRFYLWGEFSVAYGTKHASFDIRGCHPDHLYLERTILVAGRFINEFDVRKRRKVAVIGPEVQSALFGVREPLGEYITIRGVKYRVVGIYRDEGNEAELKKIYIPITTAQLVYHQPGAVHNIMYTFGDASLEKSELMVERTRELLARRHRFDPKDRRAVSIQNNLVGFMKMVEVFRFIDLFVWIVGVGTIFAGVIGVGNIMLISVKERTVEIGVRKALGATPWSIISMVLQEALFITSVSGYAGLVVGAGVVELLNEYLPENDYFNNPQVDFTAALIAVGILVLAGVMAGLAPALRAARVQPVVAMREGS